MCEQTLKIHVLVKRCRPGKMCSECLNFALTPRVALSEPSILPTWIFNLVVDLGLELLHKNYQLPGTTENVCRKGLSFLNVQEI